MRADGMYVYRYWLERRWSDEPGDVPWVMFNPAHEGAFTPPDHLSHLTPGNGTLSE